MRADGCLCSRPRYGRGGVRLKGNLGGILHKTAGFKIEIPTLLRHFFDARVVACRVQNIVVSKVDGNVADSFNASQMLTAFVGEIDTIPSL